MEQSPKLSRFKRRLLTTTCLTVAAGAAAQATTITEPPGGFGNTFPGTLLPAGTTVVNGIATFSHGNNDFFEFQGLPGGMSLSSINFQFINNDGIHGVGVSLLSDNHTTLVPAFDDPLGGAYNPTGQIPADGFLVVDVMPLNEVGTSYTVTINPPTGTPEPGTLGAVGLGLAGLGALTRRAKS